MPTNGRSCRNSGCRFRGADDFFLDNKRGTRIFPTCVTCRAFDQALRKYRADYGDETDLDHPTLRDYMQTWLRTWFDHHQPLLGRRSTNTEIAELAREKIESEFPPRTPSSARRRTRSTQTVPMSPDEQRANATYSVPATEAESSPSLEQRRMRDRYRSRPGCRDRENLRRRSASPHGVPISRDAAPTGESLRRAESFTTAQSQRESTESTLGFDEDEGSEELGRAPSENDFTQRVRSVSPELGLFSTPLVDAQLQAERSVDERAEGDVPTDTALCYGIAHSLQKVARGFKRLAERSPEQQRSVLDMMALDWDDD